MNPVQMYEQQVAMTHQIREGYFLADLSDEESLWQPQPNVPPIAWHFGHLAATETFSFLGNAAGRWEQIPSDWVAWFKMGVRIEEIKDDLAPLSVLRDAAEPTHQSAINWLQNASEETLSSAFQHCREDVPMPDFLKTPVDCLGALPIHEGHHNGEISLLRRLMGKEPFAIPIK